jgi:FG-GAP-like repeat
MGLHSRKLCGMNQPVAARRRLLLVGSLFALPVLSAHLLELRSFERMQLLEPTSETSASVSLGDIDRDGDLDIILAKGRHWPLRNLTLRNDGRANFSVEAIGDSADRTYTAVLADLNGDGTLDLVVSNDRPDAKRIYLSDTGGHFRAAGLFGQAEWSTRYVTVADLNGDTRPDIIVANRSSNPAVPRPSFVCLNDGAAHFPVCTPLPTETVGSISSCRIVITDRV